jgi:hypothetical protein
VIAFLQEADIKGDVEVNRGSGLFGDFYVTPTPTAMGRGWETCGRSARDYHILRSHVLKLAFFPNGADLDWDWIESAEKQHIGELRIGETISGHDNLRVIFFRASQTIPGDPGGKDGIMRRIWPMTVFQKKRQDFSRHQITAWKGMRTIIIERYYGGNYDA